MHHGRNSDKKEGGINVFDGIISFSVRFYDNSLLLLKMCFQVFSFASKKVQGTFSDKRYYCRYYQCSFISKTVSQFFETLTFSQDNWETFITFKASSFLKEI